jgi:uncharacterized protein YndB with AHSA1/START domain
MKTSFISIIALLAGSLTTNSIEKKFNKEITWPEGFHPKESKFYVENEIEINASPEIVWSILIEAESWPNWYGGAKDVKVTGKNSPNLSQDARLSWKTMGIKFDSEVKEFESNQRIAWLSDKKSIQGYHIWVITPTKNGCHVLTAETQNGWLTFFEKTFQPKKLHRLHDIWLAELKQKAEGTKP